jgi:hypothetical protein
VKPEDLPVFQVHQAIILGILLPNSTKQAHFNLFNWLCLTKNRYYVVILALMCFNRAFLCPGGELSGTIQ